MLALCDLLACKVFSINKRSCSDNCGRLLNNNGQRSHNRCLLEFRHHCLTKSLSRIASRSTVEVLEQLVDVTHRSISVRSSQGRNNADGVQFLIRRCAIVVYPVEILKRKSECVIHTHLVDVICPYIHKGRKHDGILGVRCGLFGEATVLDFDIALRLLSCSCQEVMGNLQREIVLFLEELDIVQCKGNLVALLTHRGGEIFLHLVNKCLCAIYLVKNAYDFGKKFIGELVGCGVFQLIGYVNNLALFLLDLGDSVKLESTILQVVFCLLSALGVCIQRHDLIKAKRELQTCRRYEVVLLVKVEGLIVVLLVLRLAECLRLAHISCPNILACSYSVEYLCEVGRTNSLKSVHRLEIIPIEFG